MKKPAKHHPPKRAVLHTDETSIQGWRDPDLKATLKNNAKLTLASFLETKGHENAPAFVFLRPPCHGPDCDDFPDPDAPPKDPCAGLPFVSVPELAAQIRIFDECPSNASLRKVAQAIRGNVARFHMPDPDVRVTCRDGLISIRVWPSKVTTGSCHDKARDRAPTLKLIGGGNFGIYVSSSLIRRLAAQAFSAMPKTLSDNGAPSPFGSIHLTGLSVAFKPPTVIETAVSGYYDDTFPDTPFVVTITDTLKILQGVDSETNRDTDIGLNVISFLILAALSAALPVLIPFTALVLFGDLNALINPPAGPQAGGVGGRLLETLPTEIPLPTTGGKREKLHIDYALPHVDSTGLTVPGLTSRQLRSPSVGIFGPSRINFQAAGSGRSALYEAAATDFFGALTFEWSGNPSAIRIQSPNGARTKVVFKRGNHQPGDIFEATFSVTVTDEEGSSASRSFRVRLFINEAGEFE